MINNRLLIMIFYCAVVISCNCRAAEDSGFIIVVHKNVVEKNLSKSDIQRIYLGKMKRWTDGTKIKAAQLTEGDISEVFSSQVFGKPFSKYQLYWRRAVAAGIGLPPKYFTTVSSLLEYVKENEGAIGYIPRDAAHSNIKVLLIEDL